MEWLTPLIALAALPLTAVSALWPVIRDRSRLAELERVAHLVDIASLSDPERRRLSAYRRRLTRRVFARKMLRRRWFELIGGLYLVIGGPALFVGSVVLLFVGRSGIDADGVFALLESGVAIVFGWLILGWRSYRIRQEARKLLALYRSPVEPVSLRRLVQRSSVREPGSERVE